ncbi:hypothetical protein [Streptomyces sp. NPDC001970]
MARREAGAEGDVGCFRDAVRRPEGWSLIAVAVGRNQQRGAQIRRRAAGAGVQAAFRPAGTGRRLKTSGVT